MKKILLFLIVLQATQVKAQLYYKDVAAIFYNRCTSCHNQYSHGAALLNYSEVTAHLPAIQNYLNTSKMPVWVPDTNFTRFRHERTITAAEKTTILNWINGGAAMGDTTLAPPPPVYTRHQINATPDLELQIPAFTSNASTTDSHNCFALPTGLAQDRIIRAFEVVAGNSDIIHHVMVGIDSTGTQTSNLTGNCYLNSSNYIIGAYTPGSAPSVFPGHGALRCGIKLKSGSNIMLNIHYAAGSAGQTDSTKIRIYFYPTTITNVRPLKILAIKNTSFSLPADSITNVTGQYPVSGTLPNSIALLAAYPHSHNLCKRIINFAISSADTIPLIRVNKWNPDFQSWYTYRRVVKVTAGHKLITRHQYDNTANNPDNPFSPPQLVTSGPTMTNEMLIDWYQYLDYQAGDENPNVDSLLIADSVFTNNTAVLHNDPTKKIQAYAYPNPFEQNTTIHYNLKAASDVRIELYHSTGALMLNFENDSEAAGDHEFIWNAKNNEGLPLSAGLYFYHLIAGDNSFIGKLFLLPSKN